MHKIYTVIPCYKVKQHVLSVIGRIGPEVSKIIVVDDNCPEYTGKFVEQNCCDPRVIVLYNKVNLGVGGAVLAGYRVAISEEADVIVKIDGDGQMDPSLLPLFVHPILSGSADYTKGNRFYNLESLTSMPKMRLFGNAVLSFMTKFSSGYWNIFDPTNGYTAIHSEVAAQLPFEKVSKRYFFETDILFRLNTLRAVVVDIPMNSNYADEISNLKIHKVMGEFLIKNLNNFSKRIFYNYYLRDMSIASIELPLGALLFFFGVLYGCYKWIFANNSGLPTPPGTVMLCALPALMGLQLILAFFSYDINSVPRTVRSRARDLSLQHL